MTTIAIIAFDGFTDIDVFLHWDLLNRVPTYDPDREGAWHVRLLGTADRHVSAAGLEIAMHGPIEEARTADAVLHTSGKPTRTLMHDRNYLDRLALDPARQMLASQCSGALILGACGLLKGIEATTYPTATNLLESCGAIVVPEPFVAHKRIATAAGCLAGVELSRWILAKFVGDDLADVCINSASPIGQGLATPVAKSGIGAAG